jgi:hypothetical protein
MPQPDLDPTDPEDQWDHVQSTILDAVDPGHLDAQLALQLFIDQHGDANEFDDASIENAQDLLEDIKMNPEPPNAPGFAKTHQRSQIEGYESRESRTQLPLLVSPGRPRRGLFSIAPGAALFEILPPSAAGQRYPLCGNIYFVDVVPRDFGAKIFLGHLI